MTQMNFAWFESIAKYLTHPLVLVGFVLMLIFWIHREIVRSGILPAIMPSDVPDIIKLILRYGFWLGVLLVLAGFGLAVLQNWPPKPPVNEYHSLIKAAEKTLEDAKIRGNKKEAAAAAIHLGELAFSATHKRH